jgi:hypothetical protein
MVRTPLYTISMAGIVKLLSIAVVERRLGCMPSAYCDGALVNPTRASRFLRNEHNVSELCMNPLPAHIPCHSSSGGRRCCMRRFGERKGDDLIAPEPKASAVHACSRHVGACGSFGERSLWRDDSNCDMSV